MELHTFDQGVGLPDNADNIPPVALELEPSDAALLALALERLLAAEERGPVADRAVVLAAYLSLQRHKAIRGAPVRSPTHAAH